MTNNNKSPEMEQLLEQITKHAFGRSRTDNCCVTCGSEKIAPEDFNDALSRQEFGISRMCQACQDSVFTED